MFRRRSLFALRTLRLANTFPSRHIRSFRSLRFLRLFRLGSSLLPGVVVPQAPWKGFPLAPPVSLITVISDRKSLAPAAS
jgi:hypothetical protein